MATKQQWLDYLELEAEYIKEMKDWVKKQPDGIIDMNAAIETPPTPPPKP